MTTQWDRLLDLAQNVAKLGVLLSVLGYMSLRAHLNHLGISSTTPLTAERYLMEIYQLVIKTAPLVLVCSGVFCFVLVLTAFLLLRFRRSSTGAEELKKAVFLRCGQPGVPGLFLLALLALYVWLVSRGGGNDLRQIDVVVGPLKPWQLQRASELPYAVLCAACLLGFASFSRLASATTRPEVEAQVPFWRRRLAAMLWQLVAACLLALTLHVPLVFGHTMHSALYPLVRLTLDNPARTECGLLVLESSDAVSLWQADGGRGQIIQLPTSKISARTTGPVLDILQQARLAAKKKTPTPDCSAHLPFPSKVSPPVRPTPRTFSPARPK